MKQSAILFFVLFMFGCQKASNHTETTPKVKNAEIIEQKTVEPNREINCEEFFREVVLSSNLSAVKNYKDVFVRIESSSDEKIVLELYVKNNLSESSQNQQIVENAVAWLNFIPASEKLFDITADPEEPLEVSFNRELLTKYDFKTLCGIQAKKSVKSVNDNLKTNCKEITGEMLSGEECIISTNSLDAVYNEIVEKSLVRDSEFLLKKLPKINTSQKINKNGIVEISYKVSKNSVIIEMFYEGGITDVELYRQDQSVKRKIVYNAD